VSGRSSGRRRRAGPVVAGWALACALGGCGGELGFYWQGVAGGVDLLARARPIEEVIANSPDGALRARLERVRSIRSFASRELALPDNGSYTRYAELNRAYVVWNVFAAPELSLEPGRWCFPVAGCVAYRGYFAEASARAEAARLAANGQDVHVSGVPAFSTLGWFDDPVLSTFAHWREGEIARLLFHELAHQVAYAKDDTSFNESFATAVEDEGLARWLIAQAGRPASFATSSRARAIGSPRSIAFRNPTRRSAAPRRRLLRICAPSTTA
jgi:predicted aminopeptidase